MAASHGQSCDPALTSKASLFCVLLLGLSPVSVLCTIFTLVNSCSYQIWPGVSGTPPLGAGGFTLPPGQSTVLRPPSGWSGRIWGRTGCAFDANTGQGACATGDCGGILECKGAGGAPPVTLAEFTLGDKDFYDVSLVDGYNLPLTVSAIGADVAPTGGAGTGGTTFVCATAGCTSDALLGGTGGATCPAQLIQTNSAGQAVACRSACEAFAAPQYCCTGAFSTPQTCGPSSYSQLFKSACPTAYSYAYDDPSSTFTCGGAAGYTITFCPSS
ncbi:hypothetical protein L7F22_027579 [Adiantum nelumboides]|nr:hypothetical protein [Adiantum nelumboides]